MLFLIPAMSGYAQNYRINERTRIYTEEGPGDTLLVKADSEFAVPLSLKLNLDTENLDGLTQVLALLPPRTTGAVIARLKIKDPELDYRCRYNWRIVIGDVFREPDLNFPYGYPYQFAGHFKMSQGPGGDFSHKNTHAYDFSMPVGTPVTAARDGIVAFVSTDSDLGGADARYLDKANVISILHEDGTIANYVHLRVNGATVREGQRVHRGDMIGYSGNTGFSSGPHLHFEVVQPAFDSEVKKMVPFLWEQPVLLSLRD